MKVIEEIIDYLFIENIITQDDFNFLQSKGFYRTNHRDDDDYYYGHDDDIDWEYRLELYENQALETEKMLTDTRKRKQGKLGRSHPGKSKKYGNIQQKRRLKYLLITDKSIAELSGNIPNVLLDSISSLKGKYYNSILKLKTELKSNLSEEMQNQLETYFSLIESKIKQTYKIPTYIKKDDGFYITPRTLKKMKSNPLIMNTDRMELFLVLEEGKKIQLTNCYGKILQPISLKNY